jgi:hypothetical protein
MAYFFFEGELSRAEAYTANAPKGHRLLARGFIPALAVGETTALVMPS